MIPFLAVCPWPLVVAAPLAQVATTAISDSRVQTFSYVAPGSVKRVSLAGSFNGWDKAADPMTLQPDGRTWMLTRSVPIGRITYKFVVDNDQWVLDPSEKSISDGNGNVNSTRLILPADFNTPASPTDGVVAQSALRHAQIPSYLNYDQGQLTFRLRARTNDLSRVDLALESLIGSPEKLFPMKVVSQDDIFATYEVSLPWNEKTSFDYRFRLMDGSRTFWFGVDGLKPRAGEPFQLDATTYRPFRVPSWVEKSVIYQIFPDRFANGDRTNDPSDVQPWDGKPTYSNRFGGDIAGVRQHLDYLQALGITAVYFNPVFQSPSNHRYETTDYRKIDPQFGTNREFHDLTSEMKRRGIRTIMDFVLNHSATNFPPFLDLIRNGPASAYRDWYFVKSYPVRVQPNPSYVAWFNFPSMPKLNVMNPPTHDYLLGSIRYWLESAPGLSGLRLDVANEVDMRFWRDLRNMVKPSSPNVWIVGEEWGDASPWLQGDQWDASMDYPFRDACLHYFAEGSTTTSQFLASLNENRLRYAPQVSRNMMNLLSSHDTPRFLTLCHDDIALDELATAVQFSWVGAPSIYYGEEIGMDGGADPDNRRPMVWSMANQSNPLLRWYTKLIAVRRSSPALQSGSVRMLESDDAKRTFAFAREASNDLAITVVNRGDQTQTISLPFPTLPLYRQAMKQGLFDTLSGDRYSVKGYDLSLTLKPKSAQILRLVSSPVTLSTRQRSQVDFTRHKSHSSR